MRLFIAVEISDELGNELGELESLLKKAEADVKWVALANLHLTLKFLGETPEEKIEIIKSSIEQSISDAKPFELSFSQIGVFPKLDSPRVIWVGINKGKEPLTRLTRRIEEELAKIGIPKEKREFRAHLTLGRLRSGKNKDKLKRIIQETEFISRKEMIVEKIVLFQSRLTPKGPIYTAISYHHF